MKTAAQYQHDIDGLNCEKINTTGLAGKEARQARDEITAAQEKLREIENSLNFDLHSLERQFQGRATAVNVQNVNRGGKARMEEEHRLDEDRQHKLVPYQEVKDRIDKLLEQLNRKQAELESAAASK